MMHCHAVILVTMAICIVTIHAEADCSKAPDIKAMENCCHMPKLNFDIFKRQCGKFLKASMLPTQCSLECVFDAYHVLNDADVDLDKARVMLSTILGPNKDFIDTYVAGFRNCTHYVQQKLKLVSVRQRKIKTDEGSCSPVAILYGVCATKYVYFNCPSTSWSNTTACNAASEFMKMCKPDWHRDRRDRRRGMHATNSSSLNI